MCMLQAGKVRNAAAAVGVTAKLTGLWSPILSMGGDRSYSIRNIPYTQKPLLGNYIVLR